MSVDRREFLKTTSAAGLGAVVSKHLSSPLLALNGSPGEKVVVGVMGLNGRGTVLANTVARVANAEVAYLCDVDSKVLAKAAAALGQAQSKPAKAVGDFRRVLDDKSVDAIMIAAPDHWHTPAAILALKAGKHVYVEKPAGHDPHEDELVVQAQRKYKHVVQVGTQRRSAPRFVEIIQAINGGLIGRPYLARAWYANTRTSIGKGKPAPVPANLDYELWQGPAPRAPYHDNVIHYNWHWFRRWGTGEICNNGTHEIDVARWVLGVDYPTRVTSNGGRYHFDDDWEFPDSQEATFEFDGAKTIIWQGQSCNGLNLYNRSRGTTVLGTTGSVVLDQDGYVVYDLKNKVVKESSAAEKGDALNTTADDALTQLHIDNFVTGVRTGSPISAPVADGAKTALLCHLGTIAQITGRKLHTDPTTGHIVGDADAMAMWTRSYAPAWTPTV